MYSQAFRQYLRRREIAISFEKQKVEDNLYNEKTFYRQFIRDILKAKREVIIYSPYISRYRANLLIKTLEELSGRNVAVFVFTRPLEEYDNIIRCHISAVIERMEECGITVYFPGQYIHEKIAVIDRQVLWEGSLNILSQRHSNEIMRRIENKESALQVMSCLKLNKKLAEGYRSIYEKMSLGLINRIAISKKLKTKIFLSGFFVPIACIILVLLMRLILS